MARRTAFILGGLLAALLITIPLLRGWATSVAETRLRESVGPGRWEVHGLHPNWGWVVGRVGPVEVEGQDVRLKSDLLLARVRLSFEDVHAWPWGVTSIGTVHYSVDVRGQDLNDRISHNSHADFIPRLTLLDGQVRVQAEERHLHFPIPGLSMTGAVVVSDRVRVDFVADALQVGHMQANRSELDVLSHAINPLLDTRTLPYALTITTVSILSDTLHVDGEAHPVLKEAAPRPF